MPRVGIMGGTFDPIHYGHLIIAEESRRQFCLDKVIFVPAGRPAHKKGYRITDPEHRYALTVIATASHADFVCSRMELDRPGPSYAVDTITEVKAAEPAGTQVFFITGADAIAEILTWHQHERLKSMCKFIAATRPGFDFDDLRERLPREYLDQIVFLELTGVQISSTELRERVAAGNRIMYMVPEAVEMYIEKHGLYRTEATG